MIRYVCVVTAIGLLLSGCRYAPHELGFTSKEWQALSRSEQQRIHQRSLRQPKKLLMPDETVYYQKVHVSLLKGYARFGKARASFPFEPTVVTLKDHQCRHVMLKHKAKKTALSMCYQHGVILLDPSQWNANHQPASVYFYQTPFWQQGFTYHHVTSKGVAYLSKTSIRIKGER